MGFLDDVQASISRGTEAVGRGTKSTQLKMRQNDLLKERQKLAAQLGAALYEKYKEDPAAREGTEALFDGIAAIDSQRADLQAQIDALAAEAQASQAAAVIYTCPGCGAKVPATDLFCSGCGKPISEIKAAAPAPVAPVAPGGAATGPVCANCGAQMAEGDAFCMSCGTPASTVPAATAAPVPPAEVVSSASAGLAPEAPKEEAVAPAEEADATETYEAVSDTPQATAGKPSLCPGCGAPITPEDVFCGACGYNLQAG